MIYAYHAPFGGLSYLWDGHCCHHIDLHDHVPQHPVHTDSVSDWLDAYFSGKLMSIPPLAEAHTAFQARMRLALLAISYGDTCTYGQLASILKSSPRAVGQALGANPLPLLIPCHRVVNIKHIGGFGGGLRWKKALLEHERMPQTRTSEIS